jgi:polyisoprenyl-phosphate glycosyltransferase
MSGMAHDDVFSPAQLEKPLHVTGEIPGFIKKAEPRKPFVHPNAGGLCRRGQARRQRRDGQRLADGHAPQHNGVETVRRVAQIDRARRITPGERGDDKVADARQRVSMLVPVHEIGRAAGGVLEGIKLALNLSGNLHARRGAGEGGHGQPGQARQISARRQMRHGRERRGACEVEVEAEIGAALERQQLPREGAPVRAVGHRAGGAEPARRQQLQNAAADTGGEAKIIGTKYMSCHGRRSPGKGPACTRARPAHASAKAFELKMPVGGSLRLCHSQERNPPESGRLELDCADGRMGIVKVARMARTARTAAPTSGPKGAVNETAVPELSVVIPVFNEARNLDLLMDRLRPVLEANTSSWEIVFIDDGSADTTRDHVRALNAADQRIRAVAFSRNFGKEIAIAAGLDHARGRAVVVMDADLQHPPEVIPAFLAKWRDGYAMVYGQRSNRDGESRFKRNAARMFYRLFARFGETELPAGAGDFRLMDRKVVDALRALGERARFSKGLYAWVGFPSTGVTFDVAERAHGQTRFNYPKLMRFAFDGISSFSTVPLKITTYLGVLIALGATVTALYYALRTVFFGTDVPGFPSLIVSIMFFSGIQMISLGLIGEYVGRIFAEVKRRPLYIVGEHIGAEGLPLDGAARVSLPPNHRAN